MPEMQKLGASGLMLLPCAEDVCQECATDHDPALPHNKSSLYYQYKFWGQHGRWPTWDDAAAHCSDEIRMAWMEALEVELRKRKQDEGQPPTAP